MAHRRISPLRAGSSFRVRSTSGSHRWKDRPSNAAKSDVRLLDYCALGLPAPLAEMPPYRDATRPADIATLVPNTSGDWLAALLAFDPETAGTARPQRLDHVWNQRSIAATAERHHMLIRGLVAR